MKLCHLKSKNCLTCSSRVVMESQSYQHTNGQWFETQRFECGHVVSWIPNFGSSRIDVICPKAPAALKFVTQRKDALDALKIFIDKLELDKVVKETLKDSVAFDLKA